MSNDWMEKRTRNRVFLRVILTFSRIVFGGNSRGQNHVAFEGGACDL